MKWTVVRRRIREIWPKIAKLPSERKPAPGPKVKYEDERVFEAALYMVWHNHSMRNRLPARYPSPNPLYLRIAAMVRSRALDAVWTAYLEKASQDELQATGRELRARHWQWQQEAGIDLLPVGDFAWYDQVLGTSLLLGNVPPRHRNQDGTVDLEKYLWR